MNDHGHLLASTIALVVVAYYLQDLVAAHPQEFLIFTGGYYFSLLYLSPDLDVKSEPLKRWGLLGVLWLPYTHLIRHRGKSHQAVVGFVGRLAYLGGIVFLFILLIQWWAGIRFDPEPALRFASENRHLMLIALGGAWAGSLMHIVEDRI